MKLKKRNSERSVISTIVVLVVLTLNVSVLPTCATEGNNTAIRTYEALTGIDPATTECIYMSCIGDSMYPTIMNGDNVKIQLYANARI